MVKISRNGSHFLKRNIFFTLNDFALSFWRICTLWFVCTVLHYAPFRMCLYCLLPVVTLLATYSSLVSPRQANCDEGRRARLLFGEIFRRWGVVGYLMSLRPLLNKTRPPTSPVTMCQVWWRQHLHRQPLTAYFARPSHSNTAGSDSGKGSRVNLNSSEHLISGLPQNVQSPSKLTRQCSRGL